MKNLVSILTLATTLLLAVCGGASDTEPKAQNAVGQRVIYEMNVGSFTTEGTFAAAQTRLADLQETGIDIIWLMPIYPRRRPTSIPGARPILLGSRGNIATPTSAT